MIGSVVNYRYEILEKIGDGNFFVVYKARDKVLNRLVALKILQGKYAENEDFARRICSEMQATAELAHGNITRVIECDRQGDIWFVATEFVRGINLKERIKRIAPMTVSATVDIAIAVAEALDYAHSRGFVHGDIRPQNILVSPEGITKLTDFGIAPALAVFPAMQAAAMFRSVHYTAPEAAEGKTPQPASDMYSLGVVMYEMLTGTVPFDAETPIAIALKHAKENPRPPRELNAGIPRSLEDVILKAIAKQPNERYPSLRAMLDELYAIRDSLRLGPSAPCRSVSETKDSQAESRVEKDIGSGVLANVLKSLLLLFAVAILVGGGFWAYLSFSNPPEIVVPQLVGKTLEEATKIADEVGMTLVEVDERYNDNYEEGQIMLTSPEAGMRIKKGGQVRIWLSKGPRYVEAPDVIGMTEERARQTILKAGLSIGDITTANHEKIPEGRVIRQSPGAGTRHDRGTPINLTVSLGPKPVDEFANETYSKPEGDRREFDVAFDVPENSPDPSRVKIVVIDSAGRSTVYDEEHKPGEQVKTTVIGYGNRVEIRVYLNNEEVSRKVQ